MRFGNTARPFEHFLVGLLVIIVTANLLAVVLLHLGVIKIAGRPSFQTTEPVTEPASFSGH